MPSRGSRQLVFGSAGVPSQAGISFSVNNPSTTIGSSVGGAQFAYVPGYMPSQFGIGMTFDANAGNLAGVPYVMTVHANLHNFLEAWMRERTGAHKAEIQFMSVYDKSILRCIINVDDNIRQMEMSDKTSAEQLFKTLANWLDQIREEMQLMKALKD